MFFLTEKINPQFSREKEGGEKCEENSIKNKLTFIYSILLINFLLHSFHKNNLAILRLLIKSSSFYLISFIIIIIVVIGVESCFCHFLFHTVSFGDHYEASVFISFATLFLANYLCVYVLRWYNSCLFIFISGRKKGIHVE